MPENLALIDRLQTDLFAEDDRFYQVFSANEFDMVKRYRFAFAKWLDEPTLSERDMRTLLMDNFAISEATAYRDIPIIQHLVGNVKQANKEFQRMKANHMINEGYKTALEASNMLEVKQGEVMIKAGQAMAKVNKLDKDDIMPFMWEDVKPSEYETTDDVTVLGIEREIPVEDLEAYKEKLRNRLSKQRAIDVTIIDGKEETIS